MKNTIKVLGIIALVVAIGFSFAACGDGGGGGGGGGGGSGSGGGGGGGSGTTKTFTSIAEMKTWLDAQPANTPATAYIIKLNVSDLVGGNEYTEGHIQYAISGKYVSLDLSGSTFTRIESGTFSMCGYITSVTIPNSVTSKRKKSTKYNPSNQIMSQNDHFVKFFYKKNVFLSNNSIFNSDPKKQQKKSLTK